MFGFGKKKKLRRLAHATPRRDWEKVLDELFIKVVHFSDNGLAVISNTARTGEQDLYGKVSSRLSFRIKDKLPAELKDSIRQFNLQQLAKMFAMRSQMESDEMDCYKIKNLGLPNNAVIYFIEQPDSKKALVVLSAPIIKKHLTQLIESIDDILEGEEKIVKEVKRKVPRSFSKFEFNKTKVELLKERLNYLEDLDNPTPKEQKEIEDLEDYIMRSMKQQF
ncbi:MAG: hypothetical protein HQM14_04735 [SAR324 cluster bacterium]|nr:hypothetical protein [SAR324 cluster bacterium]